MKIFFENFFLVGFRQCFKKIVWIEANFGENMSSIGLKSELTSLVIGEFFIQIKFTCSTSLILFNWDNWKNIFLINPEAYSPKHVVLLYFLKVTKNYSNALFEFSKVFKWKFTVQSSGATRVFPGNQTNLGFT